MFSLKTRHWNKLLICFTLEVTTTTVVRGMMYLPSLTSAPEAVSIVAFLLFAVFVGSQHGWPATVNDFCEPSLFNPITEEEITLPSLTTLSNIRMSYNADGSVGAYFYCQDLPFFDRFQIDVLIGGSSFHKIVVSSEPSSSSHSFVVAVIVGWPQWHRNCTSGTKQLDPYRRRILRGLIIL